MSGRHIVAGVSQDATDLLVARGGIEPPTYRFSGGRSYQLSYLAIDTVACEAHDCVSLSEARHSSCRAKGLVSVPVVAAG
jgi:hypothetical protein